LELPRTITRNWPSPLKREPLTLDLVIIPVETSRAFEYAGADDGDGLAKYSAGIIDRLNPAGAELVVVPAVTPHCCARQLLAISARPLGNTFEPLILANSARRSSDGLLRLHWPLHHHHRGLTRRLTRRLSRRHYERLPLHRKIRRAPPRLQPVTGYCRCFD
jgi:hypothetical protein